jgi:hypothetical protein
MAKTSKLTADRDGTDVPAIVDRALLDKLHGWLDAGMNAIWINTPGDEGRIYRLLELFAAERTKDDDDQLAEDPFKVITWDPVAGFSEAAGNMQANITDPLMALITAPKAVPARCLLVMYDMAAYLNGTGAAGHMVIRRQFIELCKNITMHNNSRCSPIILLADTPVPHPDIKEYVAVVDAALPDKKQLRAAVVDHILAGFHGQRFEPTEDVRDRMAEALLGLSVEESLRITGYAIARGDTVDRCLANIGDEKAVSIRKIEGLTYIPHRKIASADELGGFNNFMSFMHEAKYTYSQNAQACGLERPRGVALIGPPGTGKSKAAMIAASVLGLDLVQLDISSMFDRWIGSSEQKMRGALDVVAAMKNCVLMVDEIDKALGGAHKNQSTDSGVSSRVLSYFLSWLSNRDMRSEDDNRVFVIVTMNRTHGIPPEMLRAGRFDRLFSTQLPDREAREEILRIHLRKRGLDPGRYDLRTISVDTDKYSGGELEEIVIAARRAAYARARQQCDNPSIEQVAPNIEDLLAARRLVIPIAQVDSEEIEAVLTFCEKRTVPVGLATLETAKPRRAIRASHGNN